MVEPFFSELMRRHAGGRGWLAELLQATARGRERLGALADAPGWLQVPLAVRTETGRLGCFEYPAAPSRRLLAWYVDHPERLTWPAGLEMSTETAKLRRLLFDDEPPGVRARAQERARDLLRRSAPLGRAWWRFEEVIRLDCVLITDELCLVVSADETPLDAATPWLPARARIVRDLEAAHRLADGKAWATVLITDEAIADGTEAAVGAAIERGAPHLEAAERDELRDAYLGNLTWEQAAQATGVELDRLRARAA